MHIGLLTARFGKTMDLQQIAEWASAAGYAALEVHTQHLPPAGVLQDDGKAVKELLDATGLRISAIAHYALFNRGDMTAERFTRDMQDAIAAAEVLGVEVVCTLAGWPEGEKSKLDTIRECVPGVFGPLAEAAAARGIRIAFENWFATNLQGLDHFEAVLEALPHENVGFNFDPSHLYWQQIDYLAAVDRFKDRIFHTHMKDVALRRDVLAKVGVLGRGWWRYVIPGYGDIDWGRFILALRETGYDGVLSVEHEDSAFDAPAGFEKALQHLAPFI